MFNLELLLFFQCRLITFEPSRHQLIYQISIDLSEGRSRSIPPTGFLHPDRFSILPVALSSFPELNSSRSNNPSTLYHVSSIPIKTLTCLYIFRHSRISIDFFKLSKLLNIHIFWFFSHNYSWQRQLTVNQRRKTSFRLICCIPKCKLS